VDVEKLRGIGVRIGLRPVPRTASGHLDRTDTNRGREVSTKQDKSCWVPISSLRPKPITSLIGHNIYKKILSTKRA
jgi:hypothetical protein